MDIAGTPRHRLVSRGFRSVVCATAEDAMAADAKLRDYHFRTHLQVERAFGHTIFLVWYRPQQHQMKQPKVVEIAAT